MPTGERINTVTLEDRTVYIKKKLRWYEKIWYFITGKKNEWEKLGNVEEIKNE